MTVTVGGRQVRYDFDAEHNRALAVDALPDPERPTVLFAGESVTAGHGLQWDEAFPVIVGKALDVQVVDLGVDGYGSDQAFLRLLDALPRFSHPIAVVTFFIPSMVDRLAHDDHPRLVFDGLTVKLVPPSGAWRGSRVFRSLRDMVLYRGEDTIELAGAIFRETARISRERGARPIFVAPRLDASAGARGTGISSTSSSVGKGSRARSGLRVRADSARQPPERRVHAQARGRGRGRFCRPSSRGRSGSARRVGPTNRSML